MDDRGFRGDQGNKGKGNRNRRDRGFRDPRERRPRPNNAKQDERLTVGTPPTQIKTPIILTKQSEGKVSVQTSYDKNRCHSCLATFTFVCARVNQTMHLHAKHFYRFLRIQTFS